MTKQVTLWVYDDFGFLDVVGPSDVFTIANQLAGESLYHCSTVACGPGQQVRAESGLRLLVDQDSREVLQTHTLLISGGSGYSDVLTQDETINEIARLASVSQRITSVCTGAFLLAEAGLLDRCKATTHWAYASAFSERYPSVELVSDELYVRDGGVITAAGIAAGIDLALALLTDDHGEVLARRTSQRMVLYLHRAGGQSQFSERYRAPASPHDRFDAMLSELAKNPAGKYGNAMLAESLDITERHLSRLFRQRTGTTPARWIERVRIDHVRERLESTHDSIDTIATECGFGSVDTLRQAFQRVLGVSPSYYRESHGVGGVIP